MSVPLFSSQVRDSSRLALPAARTARFGYGGLYEPAQLLALMPIHKDKTNLGEVK